VNQYFAIIGVMQKPGRIPSRIPVVPQLVQNTGMFATAPHDETQEIP